MRDAARRVVVLGSTGSIGRQTLEIIAANPDRFEVLALVAGTDERALVRQVAATGARHHGLGGDAAAELAALEEADVVLNAVVGAAGLRASI
ncbi:MAG: saccharopine dehydrogenase NADP-binding domain-containing protein, partial [Actinomycetota bacterium]